MTSASAEQLAILQASFNREVSAWGRLSAASMKDNINSLRNSKLSDLSKQMGLAAMLHSKVRKEYGEVTNVSFKFYRYGVFYHKGVGRGNPAGSSAGTKALNRVAKPWLNPVLDSRVDALADIAQKYFPEKSINALEIN